MKAQGAIENKKDIGMFVVRLLFIRAYSSIFNADLLLARHVTYTWTCVYNEPEIKVCQPSREGIKVMYDLGRCYENF